MTEVAALSQQTSQHVCVLLVDAQWFRNDCNSKGAATKLLGDPSLCYLPDAWYTCLLVPTPPPPPPPHPQMPYSLDNFMLGVPDSVGFWPYMLASLIGKLPSNAVVSWISSSPRWVCKQVLCVRLTAVNLVMC
jgi:hypothetical protein